MSFREGDRITDIEAASEDWWQGRDAHGNVGLFPGRSLSPSIKIRADTGHSKLCRGARVAKHCELESRPEKLRNMHVIIISQGRIEVQNIPCDSFLAESQLCMQPSGQCTGCADRP